MLHHKFQELPAILQYLYFALDFTRYTRLFSLKGYNVLGQERHTPAGSLLHRGQAKAQFLEMLCSRFHRWPVMKTCPAIP